jgi:hypothetical protein
MPLDVASSRSLPCRYRYVCSPEPIEPQPSAACAFPAAAALPQHSRRGAADRCCLRLIRCRSRRLQAGSSTVHLRLPC